MDLHAPVGARIQAPGALCASRWGALHLRSFADAQAAVFISHGFGEHCGRYDHVARALVERGVAVFSMDHQGEGACQASCCDADRLVPYSMPLDDAWTGHGRSHGDRAYVRDFCTDYVEDFLAMTDRAAQQLPADCPRFVFGHSMGGAVALLVALARPAFWSGVVLSAPGWSAHRVAVPPCLPPPHSRRAVLQADPKVATPMMRSLSRLFSRWLPKARMLPSPCRCHCRPSF